MPERELLDQQPCAAIRYLEHGFPHWRVRSHYHDAYELHLIAAPGERHALRDRVVHFDKHILVAAAEVLPELEILLPLLEQAKHGIEFFGQGETAEYYMVRIKESSGPKRLGYFCELMDELVCSEDYRLLSTAQIELPANFNRRFYEYKNMTPSQYRKQARQRYSRYSKAESLGSGSFR